MLQPLERLVVMLAWAVPQDVVSLRDVQVLLNQATPQQLQCQAGTSYVPPEPCQLLCMLAPGDCGAMWFCGWERCCWVGLW